MLQGLNHIEDGAFVQIQQLRNFTNTKGLLGFCQKLQDCEALVYGRDLFKIFWHRRTVFKCSIFRIDILSIEHTKIGCQKKSWEKRKALYRGCQKNVPLFQAVLVSCQNLIQLKFKQGLDTSTLYDIDRCNYLPFCTKKGGLNSSYFKSWRSMMDQKVREAIEQAVKSEPFAQALNLELVELEKGHSLVSMIYEPEKMNNIYGRAHGGALFALIDEAFETAAQTDGTVAVALNVNVTYVSSPKPGLQLRAEARRVSQTKKTASYDIKVTDENGDLIALCQALAFDTGKPIPFL